MSLLTGSRLKSVDGILSGCFAVRLVHSKFPEELAGEGDHVVLRFAQDLRSGFALSQCAIAQGSVHEVGLDAADGEVHNGEAARGGIDRFIYFDGVVDIMGAKVRWIQSGMPSMRASSSRENRKGIAGKRIISRFTTFRQDAQSQRLRGTNSVVFCHPVAKATGKRWDFCNPTAIILPFDFNFQRHGENIVLPGMICKTGNMDLGKVAGRGGQIAF